MYIKNKIEKIFQFLSAISIKKDQDPLEYGSAKVVTKAR
jgi:hypothetical protein